MKTHVDKTQENKNQSVANDISQKKTSTTPTFQFVDNRPEAIAQRKLQEISNNSPQVKQFRAFQGMANNSPRSKKADSSSTLNSLNGGLQTVSIKEIGPQIAMQTGSPKNSGDRKKTGIKKTATANDTLGRDPVAELGADYGLTWPQRLVITFDVKKSGDVWEPQLKDLTGEYSKQARLLGHQTDVTSANQANTALESTQIISAFDSLGTPGAIHNWYSLEAVEAHEGVHARSILSALTDKKDEIAALIKAVTTPIATSADEAIAKATISALPAFAIVVTNSFRLWDDRFDDLIANDHVAGGATEKAEKRITNPIKEEIKKKQVEQKWLPKPPMVDLYS